MCVLRLAAGAGKEREKVEVRIAVEMAAEKMREKKDDGGRVAEWAVECVGHMEEWRKRFGGRGEGREGGGIRGD